MRASDHWSNARAAMAVRRGLDPSIPRYGSPASNLRDFRTNAHALMARAAELGDLVRVDMLYKPTVLVCDPADISAVFSAPEVWQRGDGLVPLIGRNTLTTNGDEWLFNRQAIQPSFHPHMAARAVDSLSAEFAAAIDGWGRFARGGEPFDAAWHSVRLFARHATASFGFALTDEEADQFPEALLRLQRWAFRVVAGGSRRTRQADRDLAMLDGIVARALRTPPPSHGPPTYLERLRQDMEVDRDRLRDHMMLALIASADNPPNVVAFTLWLLARSPEHQEAARAEVLSVLGDGIVTAENIERMPMLLRIVNESMRLIPSVWFLARTATTDTTLAGRTISAGTLVFPAPYFAHRRASVWDEPNTFQPDRFLPEAIDRIPEFAFMPFGAGPRMCIGARLATLEIRAALALFLQRFRATPAEQTELELEGFFALRAPAGVPIRLEPVGH